MPTEFAIGTRASSSHADRSRKAGEVIGRCKSRHRSSGFRAFRDEVEHNVPAELDVQVVMDNASSHKTKMIRDWFAKRPRWHMHFTPTSSSWLNQVECFCRRPLDAQPKGEYRDQPVLYAKPEIWRRPGRFDGPLWPAAAPHTLARLPS